MGPQCNALVLLIYTPTFVVSVLQAFSRQSPIVVFDPTIESHQIYKQYLSTTDQHSSDSRNRIVSQSLPQIPRKIDNVEPNISDYLNNYEPLKIPVREKQQYNYQDKLPPRLAAAVNYNNLVGKRHLDETAYIATTFPAIPYNYKATNPVKNPDVARDDKQQYYKNYLPSDSLETRVKKNYENNGQVDEHEKIYENGYEKINPMVNPHIRHVNPIKRNQINANIYSSETGNDVRDNNFAVKGEKQKLIKNHRINKPKVRPENEGYNYENVEFTDSRKNDREQSREIDFKPIEKYQRPVVYDEVRRQDEHVEAIESEKKEEHHQPQEHSMAHEEGEVAEGHEDHHEAGGEEEKKGYESHHEHEKGEKGHHDKEDHDKHYDEEEGKVKKHSDDSSYYKHYASGEKKEKESEFDEEGKFNKGHSTKGNHVVHKKDEYEKLEEFYDESHDEDGNEKEGAYHHEYEKDHGGSYKSGHYDAGEEEAKHGKKSEHEKGHHYNEKKGHDQRQGDDKHHEKASKYGKKSGHEDGKKWEYKEEQ